MLTAMRSRIGVCSELCVLAASCRGNPMTGGEHTASSRTSRAGSGSATSSRCCRLRKHGGASAESVGREKVIGPWS